MTPLPSAEEDKCRGQMLGRCLVKGERKIRVKRPTWIWIKQHQRHTSIYKVTAYLTFRAKAWKHEEEGGFFVSAGIHQQKTWGLTKAGVYFAVFRTNDDTVRVFTSQWPMHDIFSIVDKEKQSEKPSSWGTRWEIFKESTQFQKTYFFTRLYWYTCPCLETSEISAWTTIQWSGI